MALAERYPVSLIRLSRNFGKEAALSAGLDHADGDVVMLMDSDLQHPIEVLDDDSSRNGGAGADMVYGVRAHRADETALKRVLTGLFYRLLSRSANVEITADAGDFRLMDRRVVGGAAPAARALADDEGPLCLGRLPEQGGQLHRGAARQRADELRPPAALRAGDHRLHQLQQRAAPGVDGGGGRRLAAWRSSTARRSWSRR